MQKFLDDNLTNKSLAITKEMFAQANFADYFKNFYKDLIFAALCYQSGIFDIAKNCIDKTFQNVFFILADLWNVEGTIQGYYDLTQAIFENIAIVTFQTHTDYENIPAGEIILNVTANIGSNVDLAVSKGTWNNRHILDVAQENAETKQLDLFDLQVTGREFLDNKNTYIELINAYTPAGIHLVYNFNNIGE